DRGASPARGLLDTSSSSPSSSRSRQHLVTAVSHALVEGTLERGVRLHAPDGSSADAAHRRTGEGPATRTAGGCPDPSARRSPDQTAADGAPRGLPGGRSRHLDRQLPALRLITGDELRPPAAVAVDSARPP